MLFGANIGLSCITLSLDKEKPNSRLYYPHENLLASIHQLVMPVTAYASSASHTHTHPHHSSSSTTTTTQPLPSPSAPVLRLRAAAPPPEARQPRIHWAEDVVDNEGLGRKRSKGSSPYSSFPLFSTVFIKRKGKERKGKERKGKQ